MNKGNQQFISLQQMQKIKNQNTHFQCQFIFYVNYNNPNKRTKYIIPAQFIKKICRKLQRIFKDFTHLKNLLNIKIFYKMKTIFLVSNHQVPLNLLKLSSCLYYEQQKKQFYRLNFMPPCTVFANESVQKREILTLNKIDPVFLMITQLYAKKKVKQDELTYEGLKYNKNWQKLAYIDEINGNVVYSYNKEKIFNFLEKKVTKMEQYLYENNPLDRIKLLQLQGKPISSDTIILLNNQLPHDLVHQLVKQRYDHNLNRKRAPQVEEVQALKPKPSKNNKKPQQKIPEKPKNQPTLFASWKKQ